MDRAAGEADGVCARVPLLRRSSSAPTQARRPGAEPRALERSRRGPSRTPAPSRLALHPCDMAERSSTAGDGDLDRRGLAERGTGRQAGAAVTAGLTPLYVPEEQAGNHPRPLRAQHVHWAPGRPERLFLQLPRQSLSIGRHRRERRTTSRKRLPSRSGRDRGGSSRAGQRRHPAAQTSTSVTSGGPRAGLRSPRRRSRLDGPR